MKKIDNLNIGSYVESAQGGDKGQVYIVVGFEPSGYLLLVNGSRHKLGSPKRKNKLHVKAISITQAEIPKTDALVVTAIRRCSSGIGEKT